MYTIFAPAKINLALDVITKRPDGYHEVDMIMQSIALVDQLTVGLHHQIELTCSNHNLPTDQRNIVWRAAKLLQEATGTNRGVKIHITKNIPIAAGLAGGSSDAAAVMIALNKIWELGLTKAQLMELGLKLGADVPFCILQGTARAQGIGERLTSLESKLKSLSLLLVTPNIEVPTAYIYGKLQLANILHRPKLEEVILAILNGNVGGLNADWGNVLEEVVLAEVPLLEKVKAFFLSFGLNENLMSGSGPSVFAVNPPKEVVEPFLAALPRDWFGCLTYFQN